MSSSLEKPRGVANSCSLVSFAGSWEGSVMGIRGGIEFLEFFLEGGYN